MKFLFGDLLSLSFGDQIQLSFYQPNSSPPIHFMAQRLPFIQYDFNSSKAVFLTGMCGAEIMPSSSLQKYSLCFLHPTIFFTVFAGKPSYMNIFSKD